MKFIFKKLICHISETSTESAGTKLEISSEGECISMSKKQY